MYYVNTYIFLLAEASSLSTLWELFTFLVIYTHFIMLPYEKMTLELSFLIPQRN